MFGELPLAIVACDVRGQLTHYNRAAQLILGIPGEDRLCGLPRNPYPLTSQIYLPDGTTPVAREDRPLARTLRGETVKNAEYIMVRPDGARARVGLSSAQRLTGPAGQPLGALAVIEDITERRQAEEELERVHKQLLIASRQAGMAEVATNVLHNVGNVLNSVNVSAQRGLRARQEVASASASAAPRHCSTSTPGDLADFLDRMRRASTCRSYLTQLAAELTAERDAAVTELTELRSNIEHIKEIVAMQQSYAKRGGVTETVDVRELVEDSLRMNEGAFSRHGVTIVRDFAEVPAIEVESTACCRSWST